MVIITITIALATTPAIASFAIVTITITTATTVIVTTTLLTPVAITSITSIAFAMTITITIAITITSVIAITIDVTHTIAFTSTFPIAQKCSMLVVTVVVIVSCWHSSYLVVTMFARASIAFILYIVLPTFVSVVCICTYDMHVYIYIHMYVEACFGTCSSNSLPAAQDF